MQDACIVRYLHRRNLLIRPAFIGGHVSSQVQFLGHARWQTLVAHVERLSRSNAGCALCYVRHCRHRNDVLVFVSLSLRSGCNPRYRWNVLRPSIGANMLPLVIGVAFLVLLTAALARYSTLLSRLGNSDRTGAFVFFLVVGLPVFFAGLFLIADFIIAH